MTTPAPAPMRVMLVNGGFEQPQAVTSWRMLPDASQPQQPLHVPGWLTTEPDHLIELWHDGYEGVPAPEGDQFCELNANEPSTLYQDLPTTPGTTLYWQLYHRGTAGADTAAVDIGAPDAVVEQQSFTDDNTAWGFHSGTYAVPDGQTTTRFALRAVSSAGGRPNVGNLVDGVFFGSAPFVVLSKTAVPEGPLQVGDVVTYRVTATNEGGGAAEALQLTDTIPAGMTYLPGSLRIVDGPNAGVMTDQPGDDQASYDPAARQVVFNLGTGATATQPGSLPNTLDLPAGTTVEYRATIDLSGAGTDIANQATAGYQNLLGPTPEDLTATSNATTTTVAAAADLTVVKAADQTTATVGQTITYRVCVTNGGPDDATGVTVTDLLPDSLAYLSATPTEGDYDPTTGLWTIDTLPVGTAATLTLRAKATAPGTVTNTATAAANETEPTPATNTDSTTVCVHPAPACCTCPCQMMMTS